MNVLKSLSVLLLPFVFIISVSAHAELCFFGYQANSVSSVNEIYADFGLTPNAGIVFGKDFKELKKTAQALNENGAKAVIMLSDLIFDKFPPEEGNCSDYGNAEKATGAVSLRLKVDWKERLSTFLISEKDYLDSGNVMILAISDEVNNVCVPTSDIEDVAKFIKSLDVNVPLGVVYDLTAYENQMVGANPLPTSLPENVDVIGVFEYGIFDPNDPKNPLNATKDWKERWNNFKSILGSRKVVFILNAFCNNIHTQLGWVQNCTPEYVKPLTVLSYRWRDWALSEPDVIGILAFTWKSWNYPVWVGTRDMHKVVQNSHQNIINAINCEYDGLNK